MYRRVQVFTLFIALALLAGVAGVPTAHAVTYAVLASVPDNTTVNSNCSLREAIQAAQTNSAFDTCPAGSNVATDVIILESGKVYTLTLAGGEENGNAAGDLDLTSNNAAPVDIVFTTDGEEPATIVQTAPLQRIFDVLAIGGVFEFSNLILTGGQGDFGGAIRAQTGTLDIDGLTFEGNFSSTAGFFGGGLWVAVQATVTNSVFRNNASTGYGGAIYTTGNLTVTNSLFEGNSGFNGGAIGTVFLGGSTITADINNNTFVNNTSTGNSAGSDVHAESPQTTLVVNNNTFTGGASNNGAVIRVNNIAATTITNNIITATPTTQPCSITSPGTPAIGFNRIHIASAACSGPILSANSLSALGDYGGATETILLRPGSNALDGGLHTFCEATDARGVARRIGVSLCDIGAVEMYRLSFAAPGSTPESGTVSYTLNLVPPPTAQTPVIATVSTASGTATSGVDFTGTSQTFVFDNETAHTFNVSHTSDSIDEPDENYLIHIYQESGFALVSPPFTGTITDNDTAGVNISPPALLLTEGTGFDSFDVSLTSQPTANVDVTLTFDNEDYDMVASRATETFTATITPGGFASPVNFDFAAIADQLSEDNEVELIAITTDSADPLYDNLLLSPVSVTITDADPNLLVNGGFEQDSAGGASTSDKNALGWAASPAANGSSRRECKPSGDGSLCAWLFKGGTGTRSVKQTLTLPAFTVGDLLVMTGKVKRAGIASGVNAKLLIKFTDGQKDSATLKFAAGTDGAFVGFSRNLALNAPLADMSSVTFTLTNKAASGKIYFDDVAVYVQPRFPRERGGDVLPPPSAPEGMRRGGN